MWQENGDSVGIASCSGQLGCPRGLSRQGEWMRIESNLYSSRSAGLMKVGREVVGEWSSARDRRLLTATWNAQEYSPSRENGWQMEANLYSSSSTGQMNVDRKMGE